MEYVSIIVSVATTIFALAACWVAWLALRFGMVKELMRTYATPDMADAVKTLWDFYRRTCNEDPKKVSEKFKMYRDTANDRYKKINDARRSVSHFYQLMSVMYHRWSRFDPIKRVRVLDTKLLFKVWHERDLKIIPEVIIPLEKELVKHLGGKWEEKDFELLNFLYTASAKQCAKHA